jgi:lipopolysaccharide export LptBFGC system permease protein LptF
MWIHHHAACDHARALALYGLQLWSRLRLWATVAALTTDEVCIMAASNRRTRRLKLLIGVAVIAACVGYLVYGGIQETIVYFVTPSELHARDVVYGKSLRLEVLWRVGQGAGHLVPYLRFGR